MTYEVRKTGDNRYYITSVDENSLSMALYIDEKLVTFDDALDAKEYIRDTFKPINKKTRR
jgi:hypothetical protein